MDFYQAVERRRTFREWEKADVPEDTIHRILQAGLMAPSNNHLRQWEYIVLHNEKEKKRALKFVRDGDAPFCSQYRTRAYGRSDADHSVPTTCPARLRQSCTPALPPPPGSGPKERLRRSYNPSAYPRTRRQRRPFPCAAGNGRRSPCRRRSSHPYASGR